MPIPDYQTCMLPVLRFHEDGKEHDLHEVVDHVAALFKLSESERRELLQSGQEILENRVGWARTYLKKSLALDSPRRGLTRITERGKAILRENPGRVDVKYLMRYPEFVDFKTRKRIPDSVEEAKEVIISQTPEETIDYAYRNFQSGLAVELLARLKSCSSDFFERLVVDVIVKMGYGGSRADAGRAVGKSGDGGIDGIIKEDKLGLDAIYIQAKRWENTVGRPEIQKFVGALSGQKARKGLFITTSDFSKDAQAYVSMIDTKVVLIDGNTLAELMIQHNVGVSTIATYELKKIDSDYFIED